MPSADAGDGDDKCSKAVDNIDRCIALLVESPSYGEDELDQSLADGVTINTLAPSMTGFPAWSRTEDRVERDEDTDRGHADLIVPAGADNDTPRILYCHGGGYEHYSPQDMYRPVTTRLAAHTGMPVLAFDYRLAPEFRHPAQLDDAVQAYRWLAENGPQGQGRATALFIAGDSAGGGLALALAVKLRDAPIQDAPVAGVAVVSPETDLSCSGESYQTRRWVEGGGPACDPIFRDEDPAQDSMQGIYRLLGEPGEHGSFPVTEPSISVLHAELHGLPPTLIQVGDAEVMLSDSVDFGNKARAAGSSVEVIVWPRMWHTFTQYTEGCGGPDAEPLEEAVSALARQTEFLKGLAPKP